MNPVSSIGVMAVEHRPLDALDRNLALIEEVGADHAELAAHCLDVIAGGRLDTGRMARLREVLDRRALAYTVHAPLVLNLMDEQHAESHRAVARACLDLCAEMGAGVLVVHPGWLDARQAASSIDRLMAMERAQFADLAAAAAERDVVLALENMGTVEGLLSGSHTTYALDPGRVAAQIQAVDHPNLRATIDFSHAALAASWRGTDLAGSLAPLAPWARHLHMHDSFGQPVTLPDAAEGELLAFGQGDLHLPLGMGSIDWEGLLPQLPVPSGVSATLEIKPHYAEPDVLADTVNRARELAGKMVVAG